MLLSIKKTILVVDDDKDMQTYIHKILTNLGYEVLLTSNTEDAFALVLDHVPHLVLLDVNLEGEYGFSLLEKMGQVDLLNKINVFMISNASNKQSIVLSKEFGVEGFLLKPINNNILMNTAKKYVKEYEFPPMNFSQEAQNDQLLTLKIPGEITKFNEVSFSIRSKIKFKEKRRIEIESDFLKGLGVNRGHYKVYQQSRDINPGIYDTIIQFIGLNDSTLQNIRKIQTKKV